jgi:hypothetical protein
MQIIVNRRVQWFAKLVHPVFGDAHYSEYESHVNRYFMKFSHAFLYFTQMHDRVAYHSSAGVEQTAICKESQSATQRVESVRF